MNYNFKLFLRLISHPTTIVSYAASVAKPSITSQGGTDDYTDSVWLAAVFPIQSDSGISVLANKPPLSAELIMLTIRCMLQQLVSRGTDKREHNQQWRRWLAHHVSPYLAVRAYLCNFFFNTCEEMRAADVCQWVFGWQEVKNTLLRAAHLTLPPLSWCQHDITGDLVSAYQR